MYGSGYLGTIFDTDFLLNDISGYVANTEIICGVNI